MAFKLAIPLKSRKREMILSEENTKFYAFAVFTCGIYSEQDNTYCC